jgi:hypothetical protein
MSNSTSNIRVFVHWAESTVFAGEDVECQITFKNIAPVPDLSRSPSRSSKTNGFAPGVDRQRKASPLQNAAANSRTLAPQNLHPSSSAKGHRPTLSLNVTPGATRLQDGPTSWSASQNGAPVSHKHKRSVSIISIGASDTAADINQSHNGVNSIGSPRRPRRHHARSASLQIVPRRAGGSIAGGPMSGTLPFEKNDITLPMLTCFQLH